MPAAKAMDFTQAEGLMNKCSKHFQVGNEVLMSSVGICTTSAETRASNQGALLFSLVSLAETSATCRVWWKTIEVYRVFHIANKVPAGSIPALPCLLEAFQKHSPVSDNRHAISRTPRKSLYKCNPLSVHLGGSYVYD